MRPASAPQSAPAPAPAARMKTMCSGAGVPDAAAEGDAKPDADEDEGRRLQQHLGDGALVLERAEHHDVDDVGGREAGHAEDDGARGERERHRGDRRSDRKANAVQDPRRGRGGKRNLAQFGAFAARPRSSRIRRHLPSVLISPETIFAFTPSTYWRTSAGTARFALSL